MSKLEEKMAELKAKQREERYTLFRELWEQLESAGPDQAKTMVKFSQKLLKEQTASYPTLTAYAKALGISYNHLYNCRKKPTKAFKARVVELAQKTRKAG